MGSLPSGQLDDAASADVGAAHVFVRTFSVPAGLPWDQVRAAQLEVRHGAPLAISELMHRLKRLVPWRLGQPARFAAFYIRRKDYTTPFETTVDVDGQSLRVAFGASGDQLKKARWVVMIGGASVAAVLVMVGATNMVLSARGGAAERLDRLERQVAAKARAAERLDREHAQNAALARRQGAGGLPRDVIADFTWLARAKAPQARLTAIHWDEGLLAVEVRGDGPPVATLDRALVRDAKPIRDGVWLWGISPSAPKGGRLTSAKMRDAP